MCYGRYLLEMRISVRMKQLLELKCETGGGTRCPIRDAAVRATSTFLCVKSQSPENYVQRICRYCYTNQSHVSSHILSYPAHPC